jgi:hypothetical protein
MRFHTPVDLGRVRWSRPRLAVQRRGFPFSDKPTADAVDGVHVHAELLGNLITRKPTAKTLAIAQQQDLGMADLLDRGMPVAGEVGQPLALFGREDHGVQVRSRLRHDQASLPTIAKMTGPDDTTTHRFEVDRPVGWVERVFERCPPSRFPKQMDALVVGLEDVTGQ